MKFILRFLRRVFPSLASAGKSVLIGVCTGLMIYINNFQWHFFSKLYFGYTVLITITAAIIAACIREYFLNQKILSMKKCIRIWTYVFSFLFAVILFVNTQAQFQPLYVLLPDTQLQIRIPIGQLQGGQEDVRLLRIETGQGFVHFSNMDFKGSWEQDGKNILFSSDQEAVINWEGKVGPLSEVVFRRTAYDQPVFVSWNGVETEYNLNNAEAPNVILQDQLDAVLEPDFVIQDKHPLILLASLPLILSYLTSIGFCFLVVLVLLGTWQPIRVKRKKKRKCAWLAYILPMLIVWGFTLLVFWPGIVSNDSVTLLEQSITGEYNDWQSAFYALVVGWLTNIWYSPAIIAILQILLLSFLAAWGLKILGEEGVSPVVLMTISTLFAILPVNNLFIITLWRDIPYAIAILWLAVLITRIFLSDGMWIRGRGWLWLALAGFLIGVLKQNGIPVVIVVFIALAIACRRYSREFARSLVVFLCALLLVKGPVYSAINVDRSKAGQENLILLHHIAAHVDAGTELNAEEEEYLDSLLPISDWFYYSCYVGTISYDNHFERRTFLSNSIVNREIAIDLLLKDPTVDIYHTFDASELVWRFLHNQCIMKSLHGFSSWKPGEVRWVGGDELGFTSDSKIPAVVQPYVDTLRIFGIRDDFLVPYLRPALFLYLSVFFSVVLVIRRKDPRAFLLCLPILIQSVILFFISYAPAVRYQYSNYLVGLFLLAVVFLPGKRELDKETS